MTPLLAVFLLAQFHDAGPALQPVDLETVLWAAPATIPQDMVRRVMRDGLGARWHSLDGEWSFQPPASMEPLPPVDPQDRFEPGQFRDPARPAVGMRAGYVAGPVSGRREDMVLVARNMIPKLTLQGAAVEAREPGVVNVRGRPAAWVEFVSRPPNGGAPTSNIYFYVHNGQRAGVMVAAVAPLDVMDVLRPQLLASVQTMDMPPLSSKEEADAQASLPHDRVPFLWLFVGTLLAGGMLLWLFRRVAA